MGTNTNCPYHSGVEAELKAVCNKVDIRFGEVNRRVENLEKLVIRIGILEEGRGYTSGSRHWTDYIITAIIAGAIVVLSRLIKL